MPGKKFDLTPLESRKQLLLVESELNRVQLVNEMRSLKSELGHLKDQLRVIGSVASSAAKVATTFSAIGSAFSHRPENAEDKSEGKSSWISGLFRGLKTGASLWGAIKSQLK